MLFYLNLSLCTYLALFIIMTITQTAHILDLKHEIHKYLCCGNLLKLNVAMYALKTCGKCPNNFSSQILLSKYRVQKFWVFETESLNIEYCEDCVLPSYFLRGEHKYTNSRIQFFDRSRETRINLLFQFAPEKLVRFEKHC